MQEREARELSRLHKLIAAAREFAHEVKDRTVAFAKDIKSGPVPCSAMRPRKSRPSRPKDFMTSEPTIHSRAEAIFELADFSYRYRAKGRPYISCLRPTARCGVTLQFGHLRQ